MTVNDSMKDFFAGTVAGFSGKIVDHPLDTVKVLLQTQNVATSSSSGSVAAGESVTTYRGAWHCLTYTFQNRGITGLYAGLTSPLLGSMAENAVLFASYNRFKGLFVDQFDESNNTDDLTLLQLSLAGAGAGFNAAFVNTPIELIKCRMQVQSSASAVRFHTYNGPLQVLWKTIKTEGIVKGLYRGHFSTVLREVPGNFCWYGTYEGICKAFIPPGGSKSDLGTSTHLLGGALAGVAYWTAFFPADTVKSLMQTHPLYANSTFRETLLSIFRAEGIAGLYKGCGITVARAAPAHALVFATYEKVMKILHS